MSYKIVPVGGRVKAASIGLDHLFAEQDPVLLDNHLKRLRDRPTLEHLLAFFPGDHARMRQVLNGIGFYRPTLKTDQGMPGNFLRFQIDPLLHHTTLERRTILQAECVAIPEPHAELCTKTVTAIQQAFFQQQFRETAALMDALPRREAEKGRLPFFLIRPAATDQPIVFGQDMVERVASAVRLMVERLCDELNITDPNLIWCQPDVFILKDGTVQIERLNCPDVGLFLRTFSHPQSALLPGVIDLMTQLKKALCDAIATAIPDPCITLLTRDEVIDSAEDLLELGELKELQEGLAERGRAVQIRRLSDVDQIERGTPVLLLNLNHDHPAIQRLYERVDQGEIACFPHPRFQAACRQASGLHGGEIPERHQASFLSLVGSEPKNEAGHRLVMERIDRQMEKDGLTSPILYASVGTELVPVLRRSLHSWRQLKRRAERQTALVRIRLSAVPATPDNLLLTGATGPRLHVYRFLCLNS